MAGILFLHGGGHSDHKRYKGLEERFNKSNVLTRSFDHHADSLNRRVEEAEDELNNLKALYHLSDKDLFIWGSSMGGHVACKLIAAHPDIKGLILQSAAAYSVNAESIIFGSHFTSAISQKDSWADSPVFPILNNYKHPILVMYGEYDVVIPQGVKDRYIQRSNLYGENYILLGAGHSLLRPANDGEYRAWEAMYAHAEKFVLNFALNYP